MVAVATQVLHEHNMIAKQQCEVVAGLDNVVRVNVDGVCVLRVRCEKGTEVKLDDPKTEVDLTWTVE